MNVKTTTNSEITSSSVLRCKSPLRSRGFRASCLGTLSPTTSAAPRTPCSVWRTPSPSWSSPRPLPRSCPSLGWGTPRIWSPIGCQVQVYSRFDSKMASGICYSLYIPDSGHAVNEAPRVALPKLSDELAGVLKTSTFFGFLLRSIAFLGVLWFKATFSKKLVMVKLTHGKVWAQVLTGSVRRRDLDDGDSGAVLVLGQFLGDVDDQPDPRRPNRLWFQPSFLLAIRFK